MLKEYESVFPEGITSLLEGLSRAVLKKRPDNVKRFALYYVTELKKYRRENPQLNLDKLVTEFHKSRGPWPGSNAESLLSVGFEEELNKAGFRPILALSSKDKSSFPNQVKNDQALWGPTLSKANKGGTVLSNFVEGCNGPTKGVYCQGNYAQQSQLKHGDAFFCISDHSPNRRPRSANKRIVVPTIWGKDGELLRTVAKKIDSDNCTYCVMGNKSLKNDLGFFIKMEENHKTQGKEGPRSSNGRTMRSSLAGATQGDQVELTTAAESTMRSETLCGATTKPQRVQFGAWDQLPEESFTRKTTTRTCGHKDETTYIKLLKPVQFHKAGQTGRPNNDSMRDVHQASMDPNHLHNQETTCGGQHVQNRTNFQKIFLPVRYEDNPSVCAQQRHFQENACLPPLSQDYIYLEERAPMYYPGPLQCANVCPRVSPCHCTVPQRIQVPPCVVGRPQTTGGIKHTVRKPWEPCCWNEQTPCAPTTLESNYISCARDAHAMPQQEESGIKFVPVYIPMDVHTLPPNVRPIQSESYVPPNHACGRIDAEHWGTVKRRPCSAPLKRTMMATKLGGWQP